MPLPMRVLIADDHEVVRRGLKQLVADEFGAVIFGEAADAAEALACVWKAKWDLVILDINMPGRNGLEALTQIKKEKPELPVLVLSMFSETEYALRALKAGAAGYVSKQSVSRELIEAARKALSGGRYVTPAIAEKLAMSFGNQGGAAPHEALSDREFDVMKLIAVGHSVKEIAAKLSLGEKTVFTYRARLLEKLGLKSDVEIARYALSRNLVV
jgi:two-component system invasion response regulator UvrY